MSQTREPATEAPARLGRRAWPRWTRTPTLVLGGAIVAVVVLLALVSLVWTPYDLSLIHI